MYDLDFSRAASIAPSRPETRHWELLCDSDDLRIPVATIMEAQNWILERMPSDQKLVIIIGEEHTTNMHIFLQHAVLMAQKKQAGITPSRSFAFGYELNHNFARNDDGSIDHDPDGIKGMKTYLKRDDGRKAVKGIFDYCLRNGISTRFNDIAIRWLKCGYSLIDQTDAFTHNLIERHTPELLSQTIVRSANNRSPDGITLSNICMVERAIQHIKDTQAKIYIQHCGLLHALGDEEGNADNNSLYELFRKQGVMPLVVLPSYSRRELVLGWDLSCPDRNVVKLSGLQDWDKNNYDSMCQRASVASGIDFKAV